MISSVKSFDCCGCSACERICPAQCISMCPDVEGFLYPEVDADLCIDCGLCEKVCQCLSKDRVDYSHFSYAAVNRDESVRESSSSGGIISAFARMIVESRGVVYGVAMSNDCRKAYFGRAASMEEFSAFMCSKYLQAVLDDTFSNVKEDLENDLPVLFTGTPCQVSGLKRFLQKDYDNLFCIDLICHGVPSQKLWEKYVNYVETKNGAKVKKVNFRDKAQGWSNYGVSMDFEPECHTFEALLENKYMRLFLKNIPLRPSCYNCKVKGNYLSDITLGDFWGVENVCPELYDGKGTSLIIVRTEKGKRFLDRVAGEIDARKVDYADAVRYNICEYQSVPLPAGRKSFFNNMGRMEFASLSKKYLRKTWKETVKDAIRPIYHFFIHR